MLGALRVMRPAASPPPVAGYLHWWDASDAATITATGSSLTVWADKGSSAKNLTPSTNSPSTGTRTVNGLNVIDFATGSAKTLVTASFTLAQPITVYFVAISDHTPGTSALNVAILYGSSASLAYYSASGSTRNVTYYAGTVRQGSVAMDNVAHVHTAVFNGASSGLWVDGVSSSTANPGTGGTTTGFSVGQNGIDMGLGMILIYGAAHDSSQRSSMESWLRTAWGTP